MLTTEIANLLQAQAVGTPGTSIFEGYLPDDPDACLAIFDTGGLPPDRDLPVADPTFQVLVRSTSLPLVRAKVDAVVTALHQLSNESLGGTHYYYIFLMGEPAHIGRDQKGRDEYSINFVAKYRR